MAEGHEGDLDDVLRELRELPVQIEEIDALSAGRLVNDSELEAVLCVDVRRSISPGAW
jgi:hypothetical protein